MVVYKAVVLSKLLHAAPAWWGFNKHKFLLHMAARRLDQHKKTIKSKITAQPTNNVWRHQSGLYAADDPTFSQLVEDMDDNLFANIRHNPHHVLYKHLPDKIDHKYTLRPRVHSFSLTVKTDCKNYINRMLYKNIY